MNEKIAYLLTPEAVRSKTKRIYDEAMQGRTHFQLNEQKLPEVCDFVLSVIKENYPDLNIPFHSRWGHFKVGGIDRVVQSLNAKIQKLDKLEQARVKLDLVITSVLLDAGAGPGWKYSEQGKEYSRSEGLGVASFHMFMNGAFSHSQTPMAEGKILEKITAKDIDQHFQVTESNPLVGSAGRASLLSSLGKTLIKKEKELSGTRPGNILDYMLAKHGDTFEAKDLLQAVLNIFGDIWPSRITINGVALGDVWHYSPFGEKSNPDALIPFHKLSQWLTYSLIEPIVEAGITVENVAGLTGLAEYRNGGLLVDSGLIELRNPKLMDVSHLPSSELIIEWRALTIVYLDKIGAIIREQLGFSSEEFPLAKVLEGGTWWAGRKLAAKNRADSSPPIKLDSDGTVF